MQSQIPSSEQNKYARIESIPQALWRTFRASLAIFFLAILVTALVCWLIDKRSLYDYGNALFYAGVVLALLGALIFNGNQGLVREQKNPLNPMNRAMPGTHSERTRQFWRDYMEGTSSVSRLGVSAALCFLLGWLIVSLIH